jgi:hypothetical protein
MTFPRSAPLLALLAATACRDVSTPPLPIREPPPVVTSISPAAAFAGELLTLTGERFDSPAELNQVQFAGGVARGESLVNGALLVRVPRDVGSGTVTVSNARGTSLPAGPFQYRGLGEVRLGEVTTVLPLLHAPTHLAVGGGVPFLRSDLFARLIRYGDPSFDGGNPVAVTGVEGGQVVHATASGGTGTLTRVDGATGAIGATVPTAYEPHLLCPLGPDRVVSVAPTSGGYRLRAHAVSTLAVTATVDLAVQGLTSCADAGNGRVVAVAGGSSGTALRVWLVPMDGSPALEIATSEPLSGLLGAGALPTGAGGHRVAATGFTTGRVGVLDLDAIPPQFVGTVDTLAAGALGSLAVAAEGMAVVTKPAEGLVLGLDLAAGRVAWSATAPKPRRVAVEGPQAWFSSDADNVIRVVDAGSGVLLAQRDFALTPGSDWPEIGAAWIAADPILGQGWSPALAVPTSLPSGVLSYTLGSVPPSSGTVTPGVAGVVTWDNSSQWLVGASWVSKDGVRTAVPAAPQLAALGPATLYVGHAGGLSALRSGSSLSTSPLSGASFASLRIAPTGAVYAGVYETGGPANGRVLAWTEADLLAGRAPEAAWVPPGQLIAVVAESDRLWAFYLLGNTDVFTEPGVYGVPLDLGLVAGSPVRTEGFPLNVLAVSPNARLLVSTEAELSGGSRLTLWHLDAGAGFPVVASLPLEGVLSGLAFEPDGARLYAVTRGPDRIVIIE